MKIRLALVGMLVVLLVGLPLLVLRQPEKPEDPSPQQQMGKLPKMDGQRVTLYDKGTGETLQVTLTEYLRGALCTEMPHTFHTEALKAQAVCIHSYLLYCQNMNDKKENPAKSLVDLTVNTQNWEGYVTENQARERFGDSFDEIWLLLTGVVEQVQNQVLVYDGQPALTVYCSMSNGRTEESQYVWESPLPYLTSVESPGDLRAENFESTVSLSKGEVEQIIQNAFPDATLDGELSQWLQVLDRSPSGYVTQVQVGDQTVTGGAVRTAFGLRSTSFLMECSGDTLTFQVLGYGHGVGLSQYGADAMGREGHSYQEILRHYFQGITLQNVS